jgi:hypothetical protein
LERKKSRDGRKATRRLGENKQISIRQLSRSVGKIKPRVRRQEGIQIQKTKEPDSAGALSLRVQIQNKTKNKNKQIYLLPKHFLYSAYAYLPIA